MIVWVKFWEFNMINYIVIGSEYDDIIIGS